jgi:aspartate kinase
MFGALAKAKINIDSITTSEIRISCVVSKKQAEEALRTVSVAFELDKPPQERTK